MQDERKIAVIKIYIIEFHKTRLSHYIFVMNHSKEINEQQN